MNKEESKQLLAALEAAGKEYRRLTASVLEKANKLASIWKDALRFRGLEYSGFEFEGFRIREIYSNVGYEAQVTTAEDSEYQSPEWLPWEMDQLAVDGYMIHGDYNSQVSFMRPASILEFVKAFPKIIKQTMEKIESINEELRREASKDDAFNGTF